MAKWTIVFFFLQDIHYVALDKGETALAEVARRKADQIDVESLATGGCKGLALTGSIVPGDDYMIILNQGLEE